MSSPVVQANEGKLKGLVAENIDGGEYFAFYGIPFAQPPLGNLRFKEPRAPIPWSGIREATNHPPKPAQCDFLTGEPSGEEDCLYLNVATSSLSDKKAVMVWIHGGSMHTGEANMNFWGPDYLVKHEVVLVTVGYRLGCLGFLNFGIPEAAGNQGMKDIIAGLKWVQKNIHAFGGDPNNVTVGGISAGGAITHYLTLSPLSKGLFHKAIIQSGTCIGSWSFNKNPVSSGLKLAETVGKITADARDAWRFLMTAATSELIAGQKKMLLGTAFDVVLPFVISWDDASAEPFMTELPRVNFKKGINVPLIIGYTSDEGIIFTIGRSFEELTHDANTDFAKYFHRGMANADPKKIEAVANSVKKFYFGKGSINSSKTKEWIRFKSWQMLLNEIEEIVELQMEKTTTTYFYRFSYVADFPTLRSQLKSKLKGACHSDDCGALFPLEGCKVLEEGTTDRLVMEKMTRLWTNFAKTGNPTPKFDKQVPCKWPSLTKSAKFYLDINDHFTIGINPDDLDWKFWKSIIAKLYEDDNSDKQ